MFNKSKALGDHSICPVTFYILCPSREGKWDNGDQPNNFKKKIPAENNKRWSLLPSFFERIRIEKKNNHKDDGGTWAPMSCSAPSFDTRGATQTIRCPSHSSINFIWKNFKLKLKFDQLATPKWRLKNWTKSLNSAPRPGPAFSAKGSKTKKKIDGKRLMYGASVGFSNCPSRLIAQCNPNADRGSAASHTRRYWR